MHRIGIDFISVFALPPLQFVELAAELGCVSISTALEPMADNPQGYAPWSLLRDRALRREMGAALRDRGVRIALGEGFIARPGVDLRERAAELEAMRELDVGLVNVVSIDRDLSRSFDQFAALAEMAGTLEMRTSLEFGPIFAIPDLATAVSAIRHVGRADFRLLIDTLHLARAGAGAAELAALDPDLIAYAQLSDAPLASTPAQYMEQARYERMPPGSGELPLLDMLRALPREVPIGLEIPQRSLALRGVGPRERLGPCVEAARRLLAQSEQQPAQV